MKTKKKGFPKWLAIVLLIPLSYIAIILIFYIIITLFTIYYGNYDSAESLGMILGAILSGYLVYLGFKKLIKIVKEKKK
ncbi:MAG: hypothetical protein KKD48_04180 [Nanoarchaeota archaeon]|nr:hypothetical protein [Nanoarchaeota archaeon]